MTFSNDKPIYRQIIDHCYRCVMSGQWKAGEKIPSVREMSVALKVNTHTVLKALEQLQLQEVIYPQRGMGYYLADDACQRVTDARRREFFTETLPALKREMQMLGIELSELEKYL